MPAGLVFIRWVLRQEQVKHELETFRLEQLGRLLLRNPVAFPSRLHPHRSIKPATDFRGAECAPCTTTYPFAKLDKGHALQILEQHEQVPRITRRGPEAEMLVEASCPFILGMDSQRADAGDFCSRQRAADGIFQ